ncbi:hypothetical protein [Luteibacter aegosomatissinici]|uniref:hypothetical protein n=1 Tax=Luteibacter aegosomatissinici TaxID=2911539 RepID=UPI001FF9EAA3|nr:hypothetical protein [Luteibacter aegosomatissinici]UPG95430.1 hypothetical protein L2Y97_04780 [Luteibacter aegosomatissinici]
MSRPSQRPRGLIALPVAMAACVLAGLFIALLASPAWQPAAWLLLAVPIAIFVVLLRRAL